MNWLEELCINHDVTRYQLSKSTGISQSYLSKIVNEDISFIDIKVGQYISIIDFFKNRAITPTTSIPIRQFLDFYHQIELYDSIYNKYSSGSITYEDYLNECNLICSRLSTHFKNFKIRGEKLYVCIEKSYLDAIK